VRCRKATALYSTPRGRSRLARTSLSCMTGTGRTTCRRPPASAQHASPQCLRPNSTPHPPPSSRLGSVRLLRISRPPRRDSGITEVVGEVIREDVLGRIGSKQRRQMVEMVPFLRMWSLRNRIAISFLYLIFLSATFRTRLVIELENYASIYHLFVHGI
jgi:hypothetical protein